MRTLTIEKTVFKYEELSDSAKEKVREEHNRFLWEDGEMTERMQMIADGILEAAGFEEAEDLSFNLYSQGGYPTFKTRTKSPMLLGDKVKGKRRTRHTVLVSLRHLGGSSSAFEVEVLDTKGYEVLDYDDPKSEAAKDLLRDLSHDIYNAMVKEDEYMSSDEVVAEISEANEWEYTEDGHLA